MKSLIVLALLSISLLVILSWSSPHVVIAGFHQDGLEDLTPANGISHPELQSTRLHDTATVRSNPIEFTGSDFGYNINVALTANGNALRDIRIMPGQSWSFNATVGNPNSISFVNVAGIPGGGWCNLAARYAQAVRTLGIPDNDIHFLHHNQDLGGGPENDVLIWNIGGTPGFAGGRQDLVIDNNTGQTIRLWVEQIDNIRIQVLGALEH